MPRIVLYICFILLAVATRAQYQAPPVWTFGNGAGLDFKSGSPVPIKTAINTHSSVSATQCDAQGKIMFYANGMYIWDKTGNPMPGSANPVWTNTSIFGWNLTAMIVPDGADTNRYYVFQSFPSKGNAPWGAYYEGQLTYSVVDMRLNGGMGDVVSTQNHILLDKSAAHFMTIVPGSNCDYWAIVQQYGDNDFRAYRISAQGVDMTPVFSAIGLLPSMFPPSLNANLTCRAGNIIYSYSRHKLITSYESGDICCFDFDPATGKVTNPKTLAWAYPQGENYSSHTIPAICLSPDESLLYASGYANTMMGFQLRQFPLINTGGSLSAGSPAVIFNTSSPTYLAIQESFGAGWQQSAMQLGRDNKIYHVFTVGQNFMGRVESPNIAGTGCNFIPANITLQPGTWGTSSMPSPMFSRRSPILANSSDKEIVSCFRDSVLLSAPDDNNFSSYQWQNGQTGKILYAKASGTYIVKSFSSDCSFRADTFHLKMVNFKLSLGKDKRTCYPVILNADAGITANYIWSDGSKDESLNADAPGKYWVTVTSPEGCSLSDTIRIDKETLYLALPQDTLICTGEKVRLNADIAGASYLWQDGSINPYFDADKEGTYSLTATKGYCIETDTAIVREEYCDACLLAIPTAFTPNHDGKNDIFRPLLYPICPVRNYQLAVYNRFGQLIYNGHNPKEGWNGTFNGRDTELGTYMYYLKFTGPQNKPYYYKGDLTLVR